MKKILTYVIDFIVAIGVIVASLFAYFFSSKKPENKQVEKNDEIIKETKKGINDDKKKVSDIDNAFSSSPFNRASKKN